MLEFAKLVHVNQTVALLLVVRVKTIVLFATRVVESRACTRKKGILLVGRLRLIILFVNLTRLVLVALTTERHVHICTTDQFLGRTGNCPECIARICRTDLADR